MATLLPNAVAQFVDANGTPLAGGSVYFYIPNTTSPKTTWKDAGLVAQNANPVPLDAAGEAIIFGSGVYRQQVFDASGNLIWDQLTASTDVGGLAWGGLSTGTPNVQVIAASSFSSQDGQQISFLAGFSNTAALTVNGIPVLKDTATGPTPLVSGEVVAANVITLLYEQARGAFHLVNYPTAAGVPGFGTLTNLASAATTNLGSVGSHNVNITGTTTITSFGSSAVLTAPLYTVMFAGALVLTNSGTLILPGGFNITTVANASALVTYVSAGVWRVLRYSDPTVNPVATTALQGYLFGCTLSNNGGTPASKIDIAAGTCTDSTGVLSMTVPALTKDITVGWAAGNNAGSLDTGAVGNSTYHVYSIMRPDTGVVDILTSLSATAPTMPTNYTLKRRIGSILRSAGSNVVFTQTDDTFLRSAMTQDFTTTNMIAAQTATLSVPTGIVVQALIRYTMTANGGATSFVLITSLTETDVAPAQGTSTVAGAASQLQTFQGPVTTNLSGQVRFRSNVNVASSEERTFGWIDTRGRLA